MILNRAMVFQLFSIFFLVSGAARADVFDLGGTRDPATGTWTGVASLEFVPVGNKNNPADVTGFGAVDHDYQIGKYEVTAGQYAEFLNAVAASSDPYGLYNPNMATTQYGSKINFNCGVYTALQPNMPVNYVSWGDAVRFCNWISNGQPTGVEDDSTTEQGAYAINKKTSSADLMTVSRNSNGKYFLPSYDEWYKAAYYDPNKPGGAGYWTYPTKSDNEPSNILSTSGSNNANCYNGTYTLDPPNTTDIGLFTNSLGPFGTYDQGGNVWEWNETAVSSTKRGVLGGSFGSSIFMLAASDLSFENSEPIRQIYQLGFRIAQVPEPSSILMATLLSISGLLYWWKHK